MLGNARRCGLLAGAAILLSTATACRISAEDWSPLWSTAKLSAARYQLAGAAADGKVLFAGGYANGTGSNVVDIYDVAANSWSTQTLSQARGALAAASAGSQIIFGAGYTGTEDSKRADLYDTADDSLSQGTLSTARRMPAGASAGGKVFFAGGMAGSFDPWPVDAVDVYDTSTHAWSKMTLSEPRYMLAAVSAGSRVFFGGGYGYEGASNLVRIYSTSSETWSSATLSQARGYFAAAAANGKVLFGGGDDSSGAHSNVVDMYDTTTNSWSSATLSQPRAMLAATSVGTKVLFAGGSSNGSVVDVYDTVTGSWTVGSLSQARSYLAAASAGNKALFAGGSVGGDQETDAVDIYTLQNYDTIASAKTWTLADHTTVAGRMQLNAGASLNLGTYNLAVGSMGGVAPINLDDEILTAGSDDTSTTYEGQISGSGSLVKTGNGALSLTAENIYTGPTIVGAGTLLLARTDLPSNSGTLLSPVTVDSGGTVGGTGSIGTSTQASGINVAAGGTLTPGISIGTLTVYGNAALAGTLAVEVDGTGAGSGDLLHVIGTLDITGGRLELHVLASLNDPAYVLADYTTLVGGSFSSVTGLPDGYQLDYHYQGGNQIALAVPEPSAVVLLGVGAMGVLLAALQRRKETV